MALGDFTTKRGASSLVQKSPPPWGLMTVPSLSGLLMFKRIEVTIERVAAFLGPDHSPARSLLHCFNCLTLFSHEGEIYHSPITAFHAADFAWGRVRRRQFIQHPTTIPPGDSQMPRTVSATGKPPSWVYGVPDLRDICLNFFLLQLPLSYTRAMQWKILTPFWNSLDVLEDGNHDLSFGIIRCLQWSIYQLFSLPIPTCHEISSVFLLHSHPYRCTNSDYAQGTPISSCDQLTTFSRPAAGQNGTWSASTHPST